METLTQNEIIAIDNFYQLRNFEQTLIDEKEIFHPKTKRPPSHPTNNTKTFHKEKTRVTNFKKEGKLRETNGGHQHWLPVKVQALTSLHFLR